MRAEGLDVAVAKHAPTGLIVGICGGMQMLGEQLLDAEGVERLGTIEGLGLLPIRTSMQPQKTTRVAQGYLSSSTLFGRSIGETPVSGYEIHMGETMYMPQAVPFADITTPAARNTSTVPDGCIHKDGRIFGSYLHGLFDNDLFREQFIASARAFHQLSPAPSFERWKLKRERSLDRLAAEFCKAVDIETIFSWAGKNYRAESDQKLVEWP